MALDVFTQTARLLQAEAKKSSAVLVSFSGGKDSLVCLDLCSRAGFSRVVAFYMYLVPGLQLIEERLDYARARWGIEILQYPHWVFYKCLKMGYYRNTHHSFDDLPEIKLHDIYHMVQLETGIKPIVHGGKDDDGLWRRRMFSNTKGSKNYEHMVYPIKGWTRYEVLAYCQTQKIPIPDEYRASAGGVDLSQPSLLWIYDNYKEDFKRIAKYFPHIEAVVWRRHWYGVNK